MTINERRVAPLLNADIRTAARCLNQGGAYNFIQLMASEMEVSKPEIDDKMDRQLLRLFNHKHVSIKNPPGIFFISLYLRSSFEKINETPEYLFSSTIYDLLFFFLLNDD